MLRLDGEMRREDDDCHAQAGAEKPGITHGGREVKGDARLCCKI
jgi:hypothetical protein